MRKKYLIIGGIIAAVLVLIALLVNTTSKGTLEITAPSTQNNTEIVLTITDEKGAAQELRIASGSTRVISLPTGTHRINSAVGETKSVDIVKITSGSTTKLTLKFGAQLTAIKAGTDAEYCPHMVENVVYSYNCQGDGFIYRHPGPEDRKIPVLDSQYFGYMRPYSTGFLGFPITNPNEESRKDLVLSFIDMKTQSMQKVSLPAAISAEGLSTNVNIVTASDPTKTFFALVIRDQSKIYLFKNTADQNPAAITLPTDKKIVGDNNAPAFAFDGETFIAYMGKSVTGEEHDGQEDVDAGVPDDNSTTAKADGKVYEYSLDGKLGRTLGVPDDFWAESITRLTNDYFAVSNIRGTEVFFLRNGALERVYRLGDVIASVSAKGELYMVVDSGIFAFTPQQNGLFALANVFNNSSMRVSDLYDNFGPLMFTAFDSDVPGAKLNIYTLKK